MSFILSCDFWFCCGGSSASDDPADRYHRQPPPPPPPSQTQMVAVVQQAPPSQPAAQQPCHHHHQMMMPPHLVAPPLAPPAAAVGYAVPPPPQAPATTLWPHVPRTTTTSYDDLPHPLMRQPSSSSGAPAVAAATTTMVYHADHPVSPQRAPPPRRVPSKSLSHHDLFLPPATPTPSSLAPLPSTVAQHPAAQAPWSPLARQPSSRAAAGATQQAADVHAPRRRTETSVVHRDPSPPSTQTTTMIPSRVAASAEMKASMKMKAAYNGDPQPQQPAPAVTSSQRRRPPQASWLTRQPFKTYQQTQPGPRQVSYDDNPVPAVAEDDDDLSPTAASMASCAPQQASSEPLNHYMVN